MTGISFGSVIIVFAVRAAAPDLTAAAEPDAHALMTRVLQAEADNRRRMVNYLFQETVTRKSFDRRGTLTGEQSSDFEVVFLEGKPAFRRLSFNGRTLTPEEQGQESARLTRLAEDRRNNPEIASPAEERRRAHPLPAFVKLHDFVLAGTAQINGHECWVVKSKPGHQRRAETRDEERVLNATATFWIDQRTFHRVRMDVTSKQRAGPARVRESTSYEWEQRDGDVWLITSIRTVLPLRSSRPAYYEGSQTYSNYRRFTSESSISLADEPTQPSRP